MAARVSHPLHFISLSKNFEIKNLFYICKGIQFRERERERCSYAGEEQEGEEEEEEERQGNGHLTKHVSYEKEIVDGTPYIRGGVEVVELARRYSRWPSLFIPA